MKRLVDGPIITTGLAIFSMLFGAGNLIFPIWVGTFAGTKTGIGMLGFILTAVCLPVIGLVTMIFFDGNYAAFFKRLGANIGHVFILGCMLIIGPIIGIPRIVTLSHMMLQPFLPESISSSASVAGSLIFSIVFLGITFVATYRESKIVQLLGRYISPALLITLTIIIAQGIITPGTSTTPNLSSWKIFTKSLMAGYETLDLLGSIFFGAIILSLLKTTVSPSFKSDRHKLAIIGLQAGTIGTFLLALVYIGMGLLGTWHGIIGAKDIAFRLIAFELLGSWGAALIGTAVLLACLSTAIALGAVVAEYIQHEVFKNRIGFMPSLVILLLACVPLSTFGLASVLALTSGPITYIGYPVLIALTLCNCAYKLVGFKPVKTPVLLTFLIALISYLW